MSQFVKALNEHIEVEERTSVGQPYINIVLPDQLGQDLELSTFIGENYVLVDFWAAGVFHADRRIQIWLTCIKSINRRVLIFSEYLRSRSRTVAGCH